ncbi:hypothetical protein N7499_007601 [Penicillium canescens]|uniref:mRNA export factor MEX67 n=1 Tax=Penicillium canescens TaxID=5083 RepID=A0AAD6IG98_PENCN|nr:uncharacterized protein N7446_003298 [Penicillium canescens]KAJ5996082.1 hypothetical protein N7522_007742 [Penicillium canescens]KAJ6045096.1 hypothetical protein N7460_006451 [Penicillium canescens]KAJ6056566.1 hypothetical protein N7444_005664 [Penicillium canescens]KAJ6075521.1 hypothetical protein N7446_003298 [Penicillium canescens]KAJ6082727.1 hypothetical protein N7499_007601 [Penicillium canescens]
MPSMKSRRGGGSDRGGIRKRGPTRTDRDGDMDMDAGGSRAKGSRPESSRSGAGGVRPPAPRSGGTTAGGRGSGRTGRGGRVQSRDKTMDAIQRAIASTESQATIRQNRQNDNNNRKRESVPFSVRGWKQSKVASDKDGGVGSVISFLERRLNSLTKTGPRARITKSRVEGDTVVAFVHPDLVDTMLRINNNTFAGINISVEPYDPNTMIDHEIAAVETGPGSTADTKAKMTTILSKRFYPDTKLLDMSKLASDPDLQAMGIFNTTSTESKFFPALMKVWDMGFKSPSERRAAVESASLADNQLNNITVVTTLAQAVPDIKNLDLSNNNLKDAQSMIGWRWKFRSLEFLDMTGNPFCADPEFKDTMLKWYPRLQKLNNVQVRTPEEVAAQKKTPIPVRPPHFLDESQIGETFVRGFFTGYDNDRNTVINNVYDENSVFSLNINTSAPRAPNSETAAWDEYIKKSRNLQKINHLSARMSRSFKGAEKIREVWNALPPTRHPDMTVFPEKWLIECNPVPGLPDPTGQSPTGVGGLLLTIHGHLEESVGGKVEMRSFDRTFVIGPGVVPGAIRVVSDMFCLRAYGGHEAWIPETPEIPQPIAPPAPGPVPDAPGAAPGGEHAQREQLIAQMSAKSGMTPQFSEMALSSNNWNPELAWKNFEQLKAQNQLPPTAFLAPA